MLAGYFCLLVFSGLVASFFVEDSMLVTLAMLCGAVGFLPLIILAAINNKAIPAEDI